MGTSPGARGHRWLWKRPRTGGPARWARKRQCPSTPVHGCPLPPPANAQPLLPVGGSPWRCLHCPSGHPPSAATVTLEGRSQSPPRSMQNPSWWHFTVPRPSDGARACSSRLPPLAAVPPRPPTQACSSSSSQGPSHPRAFAPAIPSAWKLAPDNPELPLSHLVPASCLAPLRAQSPLAVPPLSSAVLLALPETPPRQLGSTLMVVWVRTPPVSPAAFPAFTPAPMPVGVIRWCPEAPGSSTRVSRGPEDLSSNLYSPAPLLPTQSHEVATVVLPILLMRRGVRGSNKFQRPHSRSGLDIVQTSHL